MAKRKASTKTEPVTSETAPATAAPEPAAATSKKLDKSFPASLRRIAEAWETAPAWSGIHAAEALRNEAGLLDS